MPGDWFVSELLAFHQHADRPLHRVRAGAPPLEARRAYVARTVQVGRQIPDGPVKTGRVQGIVAVEEGQFRKFGFFGVPEGVQVRKRWEQGPRDFQVGLLTEER